MQEADPSRQGGGQHPGFRGRAAAVDVQDLRNLASTPTRIDQSLVFLLPCRLQAYFIMECYFDYVDGKRLIRWFLPSHEVQTCRSSFLFLSLADHDMQFAELLDGRLAGTPKHNIQKVKLQFFSFELFSVRCH